MLVGGLAGAPTFVVCGTNPRSASAVCNGGGDRAVFHAATEEVVVNAKEVLVWRWSNVSSIGNCVWFVCSGCTPVSSLVDPPRPSLGDFVCNFLWDCWLGDNWGVVGFVLFDLARRQ